MDFPKLHILEQAFKSGPQLDVLSLRPAET